MTPAEVKLYWRLCQDTGRDARLFCRGINQRSFIVWLMAPDDYVCVPPMFHDRWGKHVREDSTEAAAIRGVVGIQGPHYAVALRADPWSEWRPRYLPGRFVVGPCSGTALDTDSAGRLKAAARQAARQNHPLYRQ